jgi:16S rRNA (cytidine1402-2'-O)-methyltransferase
LSKGKLYLIPCPISEDNAQWVGEEIKEVLLHTKHFVVERAKTARKFIRQMQPLVEISTLMIEEFDKDDASKNLHQLLLPCIQGSNLGLMSEAGNPCIADPGSLLVDLAHKKGIEIIPLVGPSSILMALISSGFNGQNFCFHGYLPNKKEDLVPRLKQIEQSIIRGAQTQIFMETPYRNGFIIEILLQTLSERTSLCIAANLGSPQQSILTKNIYDWKQTPLQKYHKIPCIFLIGKPK